MYLLDGHFGLQEATCKQDRRINNFMWTLTEYDAVA
jgi:hypothetical protein